MNLISLLQQHKIIDEQRRVSNYALRYLNILPELISKIEQETSFLTTYIDLKTRLAVIINNLTKQPTCLTCGKDVKCKYQQVPTFCSRKCITKEYINQKSKVTSLKKYGVDNPSKSKEIKEKQKQTCMERYGVDNIRKSEQYKQYVRELNIEKYGTEHIANSDEIKLKKKETCLKTYGIDHYSKTTESKERRTQLIQSWDNAKKKDIKNKKKRTNLERYGVEWAGQSTEIRNKISNTVSLKTKEELEHSKELQKLTCMEKYGVEHYSHQTHSEETLTRIKDPDWLFQKHHNEKLSIVTIANELGISNTTLGRYFRKLKIPVREHNYSSEGERELLKFIQQHTSEEIITNTRKFINPFELDMIIPSLSLAFEFNGTRWHGESMGKDSKYHINKTNMCHDKNISLFHVYEYDWNNNLQVIQKQIRLLLQPHTTVFINDCKIKHNPSIYTYLSFDIFYNSTLIFSVSIKEHSIQFTQHEPYTISNLSQFLKSFNLPLYYEHDNTIPQPLFLSQFSFKQYVAPTPQFFHLNNCNFLSSNLETFGFSSFGEAKQNKIDRIWNCGKTIFYLN